jgi:hypothetical protein
MTEPLEEQIKDALGKFEMSVNLGFACGCALARDRAGTILNNPKFQTHPRYDLYKTRYDVIVRIAKARVLLHDPIGYDVGQIHEGDG